MNQAEVQAQNAKQSIPSIVFLTVITSVILLVSYYLIITKCCSNHRHASLLSCFSTVCRWRVTANNDSSDDSIKAFSPPLRSRGLEGFLIRQIPTFKFSSSGRATYHQRSHRCMVSLIEFQEQDMLKLLPAAATCSISTASMRGSRQTVTVPFAEQTSQERSLIWRTALPHPARLHRTSSNLTGRGDKDFIVIELWRCDRAISFERQASCSSRRHQSISDRSKKTEIELLDLKQKACHHALSTAV